MPKQELEWEYEPADPELERINKHFDVTQRNYLVPPPLKPGDTCICTYCGKEVTMVHFMEAETEFIRKKCFKWHLHPACYSFMNAKADAEARIVGVGSGRFLQSGTK